MKADNNIMINSGLNAENMNVNKMCHCNYETKMYRLIHLHYEYIMSVNVSKQQMSCSEGRINCGANGAQPQALMSA